MDLVSLALRQLADYDRRQPGRIFSDATFQLSVDEAYGLQMEVARQRELRGERICGYKVGCVSRVMQAQLGLDRPVFGHVFETEVHHSGATLQLENYARLAIEGELALRIAQDIPGPDWIERHASEAIASVFPVIELHHYVFRNSPHTAQELIANNAIHAGVVVPGTEPSVADPIELRETSVEVLRSGAVLGRSDGNSLPGGPVGSLVRLAAHLARFGRALRRGDLVLTGSLLPLYPVETGDQIQVASGQPVRVYASVQ